MYMMYNYYVLYVYTEPALHKDPDIQVFDDKNRTNFVILERETVYYCTWDANNLGKDDFNETEPSKIKFSIENWLFQEHPKTKVSRWIHRQDLREESRRKQFVLKNKNFKGESSFSFMHTADERANIVKFSLSVVVVKKQTKNLEIMYVSTFLSFMPRKGENAINIYCQLWRQKTDEIIKTDNLPSCPCTFESAKINPDLKVDFTCSATITDCHENLNASRCFLMNITEMYVSVAYM